MLVTDRPVSRPYAKLGERIAVLRNRMHGGLGVSQRELARRVSVSEGYIPKIERGFSRPETDVLHRLAEVLEADYHELAILAGYIPAETGDVMIAVDQDKAAIVRRLLRYSADQLARGERMLGSAFRPDVPPHEHPGDEGDSDEQGQP